jgi:hypothetical protein
MRMTLGFVHARRNASAGELLDHSGTSGKQKGRLPLPEGGGAVAERPWPVTGALTRVVASFASSNVDASVLCP